MDSCVVHMHGFGLTDFIKKKKMLKPQTILQTDNLVNGY